MTLQAVYTSEPWLTYEQLAERMSVSVRTLKRMKEDGMPFIPIGKRPLIRFRESEAKRWVTEQAIRSAREERRERKTI